MNLQQEGQFGLQSPGTEPVHRPPGFHASCAALTCAHPDMRRDLSATTAPYLRHQEALDLKNPDGALLCPVAYPLQASFLVTTTTGGGAFSPVNAKCRAQGKTCQVFHKFSSRTANSLWERISSVDVCAYSR
jgi:hypothetical protein